MTVSSFRRLVRFIPKSSPSRILIGQPQNDAIDIGRNVYEGNDVAVDVFSGSSVLAPGENTNKTEYIAKLLSPLSRDEVGTIRCIGLNYKNHAKEVNLAYPNVPVLFMKPSTSLADPWPAPTIIPKITQRSGTADYESELAIVIGKDAKDVSIDKAIDYILGYTASNDVSSREAQFEQSQWCFSKGFDGSCPLGPTLVSAALIMDPAILKIKGYKNDVLLQDGEISDLIFSVSEIVSFLSQGTTLPAGTVILTGTPAGVGVSRTPQEFLKNKDKFSVEISPYIGTLMTEILFE
ncbi:hypothetical protein V1511DRAFT_518386 [Dipodascopsis uninucleata]